MTHSSVAQSCPTLQPLGLHAARQASLSITHVRSLLKLMSMESVMPSNHLIICHPQHQGLFQWGLLRTTLVLQFKSLPSVLKLPHPTSLTFPLRGHRNSKEKLPLTQIPLLISHSQLAPFSGGHSLANYHQTGYVRWEIRHRIWQLSILSHLKSTNRSRWLLTQILSVVLNAPRHNPVQPPQLVISHPF